MVIRIRLESSYGPVFLERERPWPLHKVLAALTAKLRETPHQRPRFDEEIFLKFLRLLLRAGPAQTATLVTELDLFGPRALSGLVQALRRWIREKGFTPGMVINNPDLESFLEAVESPLP